MPKIKKLSKAADAAQLQQEMSSPKLFPGVKVEVVGGEVRVTVPDDVDERFVDVAIQRHFPKPLVDALGKGATAARLDAIEAALRALLLERMGS